MRSALNWLATAFVLLALAGPTTAADDPAARGAKLLAQAKAASGGAAWDQLGGWHESGAAMVAGTQGSYDTWCDLHRIGMTNHHLLGGERQTRGFDGSVLWVDDGVNPVRVVQAPRALASARQGAYVSAWGFFFPARFAAQRVYIGSTSADGSDFDVVQVTPQDGLSMELWIDRRTHLVSRMVDRNGPKPAVAVMSDFRTINGILTPFVVAESDGDPKHTLELHIATIDFSPVDRARFGQPPR